MKCFIALLSVVVAVPLPPRMLGFYILIADNTDPVYKTDKVWTPALREYQQKGSNVYFMTFIDPLDMKVPPAMAALARTRGNNTAGSIPADAAILFSIGGEAYSHGKWGKWPFLASQSAAESMAKEVATWPEKYGCDGIDMDIEDGAGDQPGAGENMVHFMKTLRKLKPDMIFTQPVYGDPSVEAEEAVVKASWSGGRSTGQANKIGIMVYAGMNSIYYAKTNYMSRVQSTDIVCGAQGKLASNWISQMADDIIKNNLGGLMVWYASVLNEGKTALQYEKEEDASESTLSWTAWADALAKFKASYQINSYSNSTQ